MQKIYRLFTLLSGTVGDAIMVGARHQGGNLVPVIELGSIGEGTTQGVVTVKLTGHHLKTWNEKHEVPIRFATLDTTVVGRPKMEALDDSYVNDSVSYEVIVHMIGRTGARENREHTGDWQGWKLMPNRQFQNQESWQPIYAQFPGQVLSSGTIATGARGHRISAQEILACVPQNVWFRTGYTGRDFSGSETEYYMWTGDHWNAFSWQERVKQSMVSSQQVRVIGLKQERPDLREITVQQVEAGEFDEIQVQTVPVTVDLLKQLLASCNDQKLVAQVRAIFSSKLS